MGILVDLTGTFMAGMIFLAFLCIGMAIMTFFIKKNENHLDSRITHTYYTFAL